MEISHLNRLALPIMGFILAALPIHWLGATSLSYTVLWCQTWMLGFAWFLEGQALDLSSRGLLFGIFSIGLGAGGKTMLADVVPDWMSEPVTQLMLVTSALGFGVILNDILEHNKSAAIEGIRTVTYGAAGKPSRPIDPSPLNGLHRTRWRKPVVQHNLRVRKLREKNKSAS